MGAAGGYIERRVTPVSYTHLDVYKRQRVQLLIGGKKYEATNDLVNWEDVEISIKRKEFGGVYRTFGDSFEFAGDSYMLLEDEFLTNYLNASAVIVIGVLNNSWTDVYKRQWLFCETLLCL